MKDTRDIYKEIIRLREEGKQAALCLVTNVTGSAPQVMGAKMLVLQDGSIVGTVGGGAFEHKVKAMAQDLLNSDFPMPKTISFDLGDDLGMTCGGGMSAYIEPLHVTERLFIFGAGHVGKAVASVGSLLGFKVIVVDDRAEWASEERFPEASQVVVSDFYEYLDTLEIRKGDYLLIVTRGHEHDRDILERVVRSQHTWLGMIGSRNKVAGVLQSLRDKGVPDECISRVEAPVGLKLGAVSPEEIAVSIAARLVQFKRLGASAANRAENMAVTTEQPEQRRSSQSAQLETNHTSTPTA